MLFNVKYFYYKSIISVKFKIHEYITSVKTLQFAFESPIQDATNWKPVVKTQQILIPRNFFIQNIWIPRNFKERKVVYLDLERDFGMGGDSWFVDNKVSPSYARQASTDAKMTQ